MVPRANWGRMNPKVPLCYFIFSSFLFSSLVEKDIKLATHLSVFNGIGNINIEIKKKFMKLQLNTVYPTSLGTGEKMSVDPCCRINRGKMHYGDTKGTKNAMSVDPCCRINRGRINRVLLYT